jgi:dihydroorotate dehydrogenase electron transfer subunit
MFTLPTACRILDIQQENYRTRTLTLDAHMEATAGQFAMLWLPRFDEKPFSLVDCNPVTVMVTAVGPFSRLVHELEVGDRLWVRGPFGQGFSLPDSARRIALVGGGYGVAPLYWLARHALKCSHVTAVDVIVGARTAADLLYVNRFAALHEQRPDALALHLTTEDGSRIELGDCEQGRVTDPLERLCSGAESRPDALFACGPHAMLHALQALAARHALPAQLSWEAYMRCAMGICGSCEQDGALLCLDGPVLATTP